MWSSSTLELPIRLSIYIHYIFGLLLPPNSKWAPHRGSDKRLASYPLPLLSNLFPDELTPTLINTYAKSNSVFLPGSPLALGENLYHCGKNGSPFWLCVELQ